MAPTLHVRTPVSTLPRAWQVAGPVWSGFRARPRGWTSITNWRVLVSLDRLAMRHAHQTAIPPSAPEEPFGAGCSGKYIGLPSAGDVADDSLDFAGYEGYLPCARSQGWWSSDLQPLSSPDDRASSSTARTRICP